MNPSGPTFLSKPNFHDQMRGLALKLEKDSPFDDTDKITVERASKYERLWTKSQDDKLKEDKDLEHNSLPDEYKDTFLKLKHSDNIEMENNLKEKALNVLSLREDTLNTPSSLVRANKIIPNFTARVGSEMRPKSKQIEADLKSLEKKNQKSEEGKLRALEANNRLMLEVMDSENIMERNRKEIKRLRSELESTTFDKKNLLEKLDQAEKDLKDYEAEINKADRALKEIEAKRILQEIAEEARKIKEDKDRKEREDRENKEEKRKQEEKQKVEELEKARLEAEDLKVKEIEKERVQEIERNKNNNFISFEEAEEIKNKLVSELKAKLNSFKSLRELDYYVALEKDKLRDLAESRKIGKHQAEFFYEDIIEGRILNSDKNLGASFNYLVNKKREQLEAFTKNEIKKKFILDKDDAYSDWKYSDRNEVSEEIADYNRKKVAGFPQNKIQVTESIAKEESKKDTVKKPRVIKPKITEGDIWWATEMTRLQGQKDTEKANQESESLLEEERNKAEQNLKQAKQDFKEEMMRRGEELKRVQAELEVEKIKNLTPKPPSVPSAPKAPAATYYVPKIDEILEKLEAKKQSQKPQQSAPETPPVAASPIYPSIIQNAGPNVKALEKKHGWFTFKNVFIGTCLAAAGFAAGNYYGNEKGQSEGIANTEVRMKAEALKNDQIKLEADKKKIVEAHNAGYIKAQKENQQAKSVATKDKPLESLIKKTASKIDVNQNIKDLAGDDNKSVEVKRTDAGVFYKVADYGIKGANINAIEYISSPEKGSKERRNNFCNLKGSEAKAFLGFNSLEDGATACLHQLWKYQTGNNKVGLTGESTLEQMIGKYANLDKVVREDAYENYIKIIQKTFKENSQKVDENTKLKDMNMSTMLEAISIAENKFYIFDAKKMVVILKPEVRQDMLVSIGNIISNGINGNSYDYNFASYKLNSSNFINQKA